MTNLDYKQFTRRHRPHIHPPAAVLFVTCRLAGLVPKSTVRDYKAKKQWLENPLNVRDKLKLIGHKPTAPFT
jgi:hypothetical protein